jgi:exo-beta-1,3-glucanase (GH17 family)
MKPIRAGAFVFPLAMVALPMLFGRCAFFERKPESADSRAIRQDRSALLAGFGKAVAYSGFRHGQHPDRGDGAKNPSDAAILEDLLILTRGSHFGLIRLYDSQENSEAVLRVARENRIPIKVMLGAWLSAEVSNHAGCSWLPGPIPPETLDANKIKNREEIARAVRLANEYRDLVVAVNVGNEALVDWTDHLVSTDSVIAYVRRVKKSIRQPVTVAENYAWWARHGGRLAAELDFISMHTYAVWEGKSIDSAMAFTVENVLAVRKALPKSKIVVSEAGWATVATEFGERASEANQERYFKDLTAWASEMNITVFFFEAFDEDWKGDPGNPLGAEKHWGLFTTDRKAKKAMRGWYPDLVPDRE